MINYWLIMKNQNKISNISKISMMIITIMIRMGIMVVMSMLIPSCRGSMVSNTKELKKLSRSLQKNMRNKHKRNQIQFK